MVTRMLSGVRLSDSATDATDPLGPYRCSIIFCCDSGSSLTHCRSSGMADVSLCGLSKGKFAKLIQQCVVHRRQFVAETTFAHCQDFVPRDRTSPGEKARAAVEFVDLAAQDDICVLQDFVGRVAREHQRENVAVQSTLILRDQFQNVRIRILVTHGE